MSERNVELNHHLLLSKIRVMLCYQALKRLEETVSALLAEVQASQLYLEIQRQWAKNALMKLKISTAKQSARRVVAAMAARCAAAGRYSDLNDMMDILNTPDENLQVDKMIYAVINCLNH